HRLAGLPVSAAAWQAFPLVVYGAFLFHPPRTALSCQLAKDVVPWNAFASIPPNSPGERHPVSYREFLRSYLKGQWGKVALFTFALFGGIAVQLLSPQVIRAFIDSAVAGAELGVLLRLAGWFLVLGLASQAFGLLAAYSSADVGWRATNALRLDLFRHVLYLDMSFHKE